MSNSRDHHHVPRFYLKHFRDPNGEIHHFNKENRGTGAKGPKGTGFKPDFHSINFGPYENAPDHGSLENYLNVAYENDQAKVLVEVLRHLEGPDDLPAKHRSMLAEITALMFLRSPKIKESFRPFAEQAESEEHTTLTAEAFQQAAFLDMLSSDEVRELKTRLLLRRMHVLTAAAGAFFWSSDAPVLLYLVDSQGLKRLDQEGKYGLNKPGATLALPLSPKHLLLWVNGPSVAHQRETCPASFVESVNWAEFQNATQYVYAHQPFDTKKFPFV
ncbi:DUF4238 domain-containing protein [Deinococcus cellulosilyticus]|uniref:DUF4238 domain-containing protein n=1 Tax=Deinococcus cellulosilyticus (strain DSM 18568 / NBRC 106333 / KACC 11606 / 5516J-15) TaxID=1223518 RepID=A0A511NAC4_DEIC1|nr:DUF4238 domain-containing protein [Deinococcus cellulosilyticus]GEM49779.1 hypothetical protein DC3_54140 [Deinococcus cellulosilyticus NBRC 106333 = KACC 11606]